MVTLDLHLLGLCVQLFLQLGDLGLQGGDGVFVLGLDSPFQVAQFELQLLVLAVQLGTRGFGPLGVAALRGQFGGQLLGLETQVQVCGGEKVFPAFLVHFLQTRGKKEGVVRRRRRKTYLHGGSLHAIVNHLRVELLFLQLFLQLGDAGLQPSLLIRQLRTKTEKNKAAKNQFDKLRMKSCFFKNLHSAALLGVAAVDLVLQLVSLGLSLSPRPLSCGQFLGRRRTTQ